MRLFSRKTLFEVLAGIWINLTSGWFGILVVVPGFFGVSSADEYTKLLTINVPLDIVGLVFSLVLTEKSKSL